MGDKLRTIQNIEIIKTDSDNDLLYLKGSIPGSKNTVVYLRKSTKLINKKTIKDKEDELAKIAGKKEKEKVKAAPKKPDNKKENPKTEVKKQEDKKK